MALYSSLSDQDIHAVGAAYGIEVSHWEHLDGGANNTSFVLQTRGRSCVLTVLDEGDRSSRRRLASLLTHLHDHDVRVGAPLVNTSGDVTTTVNRHLVMLKPFIEGDVFYKLPARHLFDAGRELARLHGIETPRWLPAGTRRLGATPAIEWVGAVGLLDDGLFSLDAPRGLCHGDYFPDNLVFTDDGIAVIDWMTASLDLLIIDIGFALVGMSREDAEFVPARAKTFLDGYRSVRELTEPEISHLRNSMIHAACVLATHRYRLEKTHESHIVPGHERMKQFIESLPADVCID